MDFPVVAPTGDQDRRDRRGMRFVGAALEGPEPTGIDQGVVVEERDVFGVDMLHAEVAGLVGGQHTVAVDQREVVSDGEPLESSYLPSRGTTVDDNHAMRSGRVRKQDRERLECPAEGFAWYHDHRCANVGHSRATLLMATRCVFSS